MSISRFKITLVLASFSACLFGKAFDIKQLPSGKQVTLNMPAETVVPLDSRAILTATESPQTVSLEAKNLRGSKQTKIKIAIWDKKLKKMKHIELGNKKVLYSLKDLNSITIIPETATVKGSKTKHKAKAQLVLKSDKPLRISRLNQ